MTEMMKKYTTNNRKFEFSPDKRFIKVYWNGSLNGFIWNTSKIIRVDGEEVVSSEFFK